MTTRFLNDIDEFLGDRRGRFFGEGFTRCKQEIASLEIDMSNNSIDFSCVGRVIPPDNWSYKASIQQKPHLSTIDVIVLSSEVHSSMCCNPKLSDRLLGWEIAALDITAGRTPVEGDLSMIVIEGVLHEVSASEKILEMQIANMQLSVKLVPKGAGRSQFIKDSKPAISLTEVLFDTDSLTGSAVVETCAQLYSEPWPPTACFAAVLQIGQALLYELDHIRRNETHTLWMKRASIEFLHRPPPLNVVQPIQVRLHSVRRYEKDDRDWRRADIIGRIANLLIICSVTHMLPGQVHMPSSLEDERKHMSIWEVE